ncbi:MAG: hypothetical protein AAFR44_03740 [Pseudomonadota bacterium]
MPTDPEDPAAAATSAASASPAAAAAARPSHDVDEDSPGERNAPPAPTLAASADAPSTIRGHQPRRSLAIHLNHLGQVREAMTEAISRAPPGDDMTLFNAAAILFGLEVVLADDGGDGRSCLCTASNTTIGEALSSACRFAAAACLEWMRLGENAEDVAMLLHPDRIGLQPSGQLAFDPPATGSTTRH